MTSSDAFPSSRIRSEHVRTNSAVSSRAGAAPGSSISVTFPESSITSRFTRVLAAVRTATTSISSNSNCRAHSSPIAPPRNPIQLAFAPSARAAIATCAALPPAKPRALLARFTSPASRNATRNRRSIAGFALTQTIVEPAICPCSRSALVSSYHARFEIVTKSNKSKAHS